MISRELVENDEKCLKMTENQYTSQECDKRRSTYSNLQAMSEDLKFLFDKKVLEIDGSKDKRIHWTIFI